MDRQLLQWQHQTYHLTARETDILSRLYTNRGELVKRNELLEELWGTNDFFTSRSLDVFVNSLRKHLVHDPEIRIETVRGKGLRLLISGT
jgi:DNA-binding response OmpR family regulator